MNEGEISLSLRNVSFAFPSAKKALLVLSEVTCSFAAGNIHVILGPSGCGKSTLLDLIAGLRDPTGGSIERNSDEGERCGFVFQELSLLPWRTVRANALLGAELHRNTIANLAECDALLERFGLFAFADSYPRQLSGGMQQRLAVIRALVAGATTILLDEPFVNNDLPTRKQLQRDIVTLTKERKLVTIFVTHDIEEAITIADRILILSARPAKVIHELGIETPSVERASAKVFNEELIGIRNSIIAAMDEASGAMAAELDW